MLGVGVTWLTKRSYGHSARRTELALGPRVSLLAARNISKGEQLLMPLTPDSPFYGSDSSKLRNFTDTTPRLMTQSDD